MDSGGSCRGRSAISTISSAAAIASDSCAQASPCRRTIILSNGGRRSTAKNSARGRAIRMALPLFSWPRPEVTRDGLIPYTAQASAIARTSKFARPNEHRGFHAVSTQSGLRPRLHSAKSLQSAPRTVLFSESCYSFRQWRRSTVAELRKLAAIMAVDVVGYSRLMSEDEAGTAKAVREHRRAAVPIVQGLGGRIVKTMGDGVLLEFPSVVAAVECA